MPRRTDLKLSPELIAETGLSLLREGGVEALSTRKVSAALGASPMSLYVHIGNKEGLLDAIVERAMSSIKFDLDSEAPWTAQAEQWVHSLRNQLAAHPGIMELLSTRRWAFLQCSEPLMRALLAGGLSEDSAVETTRLLTWSTIGFLVVESGVALAPSTLSENLEANPRTEENLRRSLAHLNALEGDVDRTGTTLARGVDRARIDALFSLQVRVLIRGLRTLGETGPE